MKTKNTVLITSAMLFALTSCSIHPKSAAEKGIILKDYGAKPTVLNIDKYTTSNTNFRTTLWTGSHLQVILMSIPGSGETGLEVHPNSEQFIRIEKGTAKVLMGNSPDSLTFTTTASTNDAIFVPAGKWHNIINTGKRPLKLYSIYTAVEHPRNMVQKTFKDAETAQMPVK